VVTAEEVEEEVIIGRSTSSSYSSLVLQVNIYLVNIGSQTCPCGHLY
jgi:hypothetical protein